MIIDSNILIYSVIPEYKKLRDFLNLNKHKLIVSKITKLEVLGYHKLKDFEKICFEYFFNTIIEYQINNNVINYAIKLRQKRKMTIGDSIIAATALLLDESILTNNIIDFSNIENIKLIELKTIIQ